LQHTLVAGSLIYPSFKVLWPTCGKIGFDT